MSLSAHLTNIGALTSRLLLSIVAALVIALSCASGASAEASTLEQVSSRVQPGIVYLEMSYSGKVYDPTYNSYLGGNRTPVEFGAPAGHCSGFFVNPDGYFVTGGHCVEYDPAIKQPIIEQAAEWSYQNEGWTAGTTLADVKAYAAKYWKVHSTETPGRTRPDRHVEAAYGVDIGGVPTGKALPARLLGFQPSTRGDVALLKVEAENVPVLKLAPKADVNIGTKVVSVGYPGSVDYVTDATFDPSFKEGSISSEKTTGGGLVNVYEVSAAVSGGMSGGPTVDLQGRVVGVNSFGIVGETQPFNFVSPATEVAQLLNDEGIENQVGRTNSLYLQGVDAYYAGDREEALAKFDEVLGQVREHEFAQELRAKALRLPEESQGGFLKVLFALGAVLVAALITAGVLLLRRRCGPGAPPAGSGVPREMPPLTPIGGNSNVAPSLVVLTGPRAGRRIALDSDLVLGRETIEDVEASRRHAALRPRNGGAELTDLGSTNGTMVNGAQIGGPTPVGPGDVITIGQTMMALEVLKRDPLPDATVVRSLSERKATSTASGG